MNPTRSPHRPLAPWALAACGAALLALTPACDANTAQIDTVHGPDRVSVSNDAAELAHLVTLRDEPIEVIGAGSVFGLIAPSRIDKNLTLVAEVAPPAVDGVPLQATSVAFRNGRAAVSYALAGEEQRGGVDLFSFDAEGQPTLTGRALFADADIFAVDASEGRVWLATGTANAADGATAVLETLGVTAKGTFSREDNVRVGLTSFVATSVTVRGDYVYATTGDAGHVLSFDRETLQPIGRAALDDARWVTTLPDGRVVVAQGTPGRVAVLTGGGLLQSKSHLFDGANVPESKSTVDVAGGVAFVTGGPAGVFAIDASTGARLGQIPIPAGLSGADSVSNAVAVDGDLVFISNGAAGVFVVRASADLDARGASDPLTFELIGRLAFPGEPASVNHITYEDGYLFVATGRGGLKVVRVDAAEKVEPPTGYPYLSDFESPAARAGWVFGGDWGFGQTDDGHQARSGRVVIDNNPRGVDQAGHISDNIALLDVPLAIPTSGAATLSFWYTLADFADADDAVYVELENVRAERWDTVATFTRDHARAAMNLHVVPLDDYRGVTTRVRLRQRLGQSPGARSFRVDDVRVGDAPSVLWTYPLMSDFEVGVDRARWTLEGGWDFVDADGPVGATVLSANPDLAAQAGFRMHAATLNGFVAIPEAGLPTLSFRYRAALTDADDRVDVQVQPRGDTAWHAIARFRPENNHAVWSKSELPVDDFAGDELRVRFVYTFGDGAAPRTFEIDDVRLAALAGPELGFPWADSVEGQAAAWNTAGAWALSTDAFDGEQALDANPDDEAIAGVGAAQDATMTGFVTLPNGGPLTVSYRYKVSLPEPADRVHVDIQARDDGVWRALLSYAPEHSRVDYSAQELRLDAFAGRSVRLRFRLAYADSAAVRTFVVDDVRFDRLPDLRFGWPYVNGFDGAGADDWAINGSFALAGSADGLVLDANPRYTPQPNFAAGHQIAMRGFVPVPVDGQPTLALRLRFQMPDPSDRIFVEVQSAATGRWDQVRAYDHTVNRGAPDWDEIPLDAWRGDDVRVRVRLAYGPSDAPRALQVGEVAFGPLTVPTATYPWASGFDTPEAASAWSLWGSWTATTGHGDAFPVAGFGFLNGNPFEAAQSDFAQLQTATTRAAIPLPVDAPAFLTFAHRFDTAHPDDRLFAEVQVIGDASWIPVAALGREHVRFAHSRLEVPLTAFAGESIRVRFRQLLGASNTARVIVVDEVEVGPRSGRAVAFPYASQFGTRTGADLWDLHGAWQIGQDGWLDANPEGMAQSGWGAHQTATLDGYVDLSAATLPVMAITYVADLVDAADKVVVEVQSRGEVGWTPFSTFTRDHDTATPQTTYLAMAAWAGHEVRVRLRFDFAEVNAVRTFAVAAVNVAGD